MPTRIIAPEIYLESYASADKVSSFSVQFAFIFSELTTMVAAGGESDVLGGGQKLMVVID